MEFLNLHSEKFSGKTFKGEVFRNCRLDGATFEDVTMEGVKFVDCSMRGVTFRRCYGKDVLFENVLMTRTELDACNWSKVAFHVSQLLKVRATECAFNELNIMNSVLNEVQISSCALDTFVFVAMASDVVLENSRLQMGSMAGMYIRFQMCYCDVRNVSAVAVAMVSSLIPANRLHGLVLRGSDLSWTVISSNNPEDMDIRGCVLHMADVRFACPNVPVDGTFLDKKFLKSFPSNGGLVLYRTKRSIVFGDTVYEPGKTYVAPYFSTDVTTNVHPGIYAGTLEEVRRLFPKEPLVKVYVPSGRYVRTAYGYRCERIRVLEDVQEDENVPDCSY